MFANKLDMTVLKNLPAILAAQTAVAAERTARRLELIGQIDQAQQEFNAREKTLVAKAAPIESKLRELRAQIKTLETELAPLADARLSAAFVCKTKVGELQKALRADAAEELNDFDRSLDAVRSAIQTNQWDSPSLRKFLFGATNHERTVEGLRLTLEASRKAHHGTVLSADISGAFEELRAELAAAGIGLT